jgi:hypothetical protein
MIKIGKTSSPSANAAKRAGLSEMRKSRRNQNIELFGIRLNIP